VDGSAANGVALRLAIGGTPSLLGDPSSIAGRGYYNAFTNSVSNVAYVFPESTPGSLRNALTIGMIASHEAGHSFGLRHQTGHLDFLNQSQATMGSASYGYEDAWWVVGTDDLGNYQDDMAMLASTLNGFGYRPDDHANTIG